MTVGFLAATEIRDLYDAATTCLSLPGKAAHMSTKCTHDCKSFGWAAPPWPEPYSIFHWPFQNAWLRLASTTKLPTLKELKVKQQSRTAENTVWEAVHIVDTSPILMENVGARQAMRDGVTHIPMGMLSLRGKFAPKRVREKSTTDFWYFPSQEQWHPAYGDGFCTKCRDTHIFG